MDILLDVEDLFECWYEYLQECQELSVLCEEFSILDWGVWYVELLQVEEFCQVLLVFYDVVEEGCLVVSLVFFEEVCQVYEVLIGMMDQVVVGLQVMLCLEWVVVLQELLEVFVVEVVLFIDLESFGVDDFFLEDEELVFFEVVYEEVGVFVEEIVLVVFVLVFGCELDEEMVLIFFEEVVDIFESVGQVLV